MMRAVQTVMPSLALLACAAVMGIGCCARQNGGAAVEPAARPSVAALVAHHHERLDRLQRVYAPGVIELRWREDGRLRREQGNMELWLRPPRDVALRVFKAGREFLWLGSNDTHHYMFDMTGDETVLAGGPHGSAGQRDHMRAVLDPLVFVDLSGLVRLDAVRGDVTFDADRNAWVIEAAGQVAPMRVFFEVDSWRVVRVEAIDNEGEPVIWSDLSDPIAVTLVDAPPGDWGELPRRIEIVARDDEGSITLFFDRENPPSDGIIDAMMTSTVFMLERLIRRMPPDVVDGDLPIDGPQAGGEPSGMRDGRG